MVRILCFGDSITFGFSDIAGGWTQRLHNDLAKTYITPENNPKHEVLNLGISGDTAEGVVIRIKQESKTRVGNHGVIIIAIGTNDSQYFRDTSASLFNVDEFAENVRKILTIAKSMTDKVLVMGLFPCDEEKMQPMPWAKTSESYSNQRLATFNAELKDVSQEMDVNFEDMFSDLMKLKYKNYLHDGIHPNSVGHQYIADRIRRKIEKLANNYS